MRHHCEYATLTLKPLFVLVFEGGLKSYPQLLPRYKVCHYTLYVHRQRSRKETKGPTLALEHQAGRWYRALVIYAKLPTSAVQCTHPLRREVRVQDHENRKSFRTGDPANSGLSKTQLKISQSIYR
jgi:hypothetical protein